MHTSFLNPGPPHYDRLNDIAAEAPLLEPENDVARTLITHWDANGGPKYLFLGPEIVDEMNSFRFSSIEPPHFWNLRVDQNDADAPMMDIDWSRMRRLEGLFL